MPMKVLLAFVSFLFVTNVAMARQMTRCQSPHAEIIVSATVASDLQEGILSYKTNESLDAALLPISLVYTNAGARAVATFQNNIFRFEPFIFVSAQGGRAVWQGQQYICHGQF